MEASEIVGYKEGDIVRSDLDGLIYTIVKYGPRDEITPLLGVKQLGNCALVLKDGQALILYDWEMTHRMQAEDSQREDENETQ